MFRFTYNHHQGATFSA